MSPETIVSIVIVIVAIVLITPVRFIKDREDGSSLTVVEWISRQGKWYKREMAKAKQAQADAEKSQAEPEPEARRQSTEPQSEWKWVGGKSEPRRAYPAEGSDEDTENPSTPE